MTALFDLSGVVAALASGTYVVTRSTPATIGTDGRATAGSTSSLSISASVSPTSGRDLLTLEEGMRTRETRTLFTVTPLYTQTPGQDPDHVAIDGDSYEVQKLERWDSLGSYFKAICVKIGR